MEETDLTEFIKYYMANIMFVFVAIFLLIILGNAYHLLFRNPLYQSSTTIVLAKELRADQTYTQSDLLLNQNLVTTYSKIIKSRDVMEQVIASEMLDYSVSELSSHISVSRVEDTEIIKVTVTDADKSLAKNVANAIIPVFSDKVKKIYNIDNVNIVDSAVESDTPYNINYVKENIIYILAGFVISTGVLFLVYYFDTTVKSVDELEDKLELTVLGVVPKVIDRGQ